MKYILLVLIVFTIACQKDEGRFISKKESVPLNLVDLSSVDTVKKYLAGTWELTRDREACVTAFLFDTLYRGSVFEGKDLSNNQYKVWSCKPFFELEKKGKTILIKYIYLASEEQEKINYLSSNELIIGRRKYVKHYRQNQ